MGGGSVGWEVVHNEVGCQFGSECDEYEPNHHPQRCISTGATLHPAPPNSTNQPTQPTTNRLAHLGADDLWRVLGDVDHRVRHQQRPRRLVEEGHLAEADVITHAWWGDDWGRGWGLIVVRVKRHIVNILMHPSTPIPAPPNLNQDPGPTTFLTDAGRQEQLVVDFVAPRHLLALPHLARREDAEELRREVEGERPLERRGVDLGVSWGFVPGVSWRSAIR